MADEYYVPFLDRAEDEFVEKKSRFIGRAYRVETEEEAQSILDELRKKYWDASHNVYAYSLLGGTTRCSDDGEPSGTAGRPTLEVITREGITNVLVVVTRYFGGTLLGAGGLIRAYAHSAKIALDAAGVAAMRRVVNYSIRVDYTFFERIKLEVEAAGGEVTNVEYADAVMLELWIPDGGEAEFERRMTELTAGRLQPKPCGEARRAVRIR